MFSTDQINTSLQSARDALSASKALQASTLDFDWNGMHFNAASENFGTKAGMIRLSATIGRLYFTVEDERLRSASIKQIHQNNRTIDGSFKLEKDGTVSFSSLTTLDTQVSGNDFIKALAIIMLEAGDQFKMLRAFLKAA